MPNPVIPKLNSNLLSTQAPPALALATGEVASNITTGYLYLKKASGDVVDVSPIKGIQVGNTLTTAGIASISSSEISGLSPVSTIDTASGLVLNSQQLATLYNTSISDSVDSVAVGGATAQPASAWKDKTLVEVLDAILFPDLDPTYEIPTITLSNTQSGVKEIGTEISQQLTVTGTKYDAGAYSKLAISRGATSLSTADLAAMTTTSLGAFGTQYGYADPNSPNVSYALQYTDTFTVTSGATSWSGSGDYAAGSAKKNNKGVDDTRTAAVRTTSAPQAASTGFGSNSATVTGIYPYFWGTSSSSLTGAQVATAIENNSAGVNKASLASTTGTVTVTFSATNQYVWVAIPNVSVSGYHSTTSKTKWYNTALNNGNIGAGQFILAPSTQNVTSSEGYWSGVSYKIYISGYATTTDGSIQFQN
jgi:hypothetical protein